MQLEFFISVVSNVLPISLVSDLVSAVGFVCYEGYYGSYINSAFDFSIFHFDLYNS